MPNAWCLIVGTCSIAPVSPGVWGYEVSGLQVVKSWLGYRMKDRKGKKSSPLDDIHPERWTSEFTDELLRVLAILEYTLGQRGKLDQLLEAVCRGPVLAAAELPEVTADLRKPPGSRAVLYVQDDEGDGDPNA